MDGHRAPVAVGPDAVSVGHADAIAFGRTFIANPDMVERIKSRVPLNPYNRATFYGGEEAGYKDYPTLRELERRTA